MQLTKTNLEKLSQIAIHAAQMAGKLIAENANRQLNIRKKDGVNSLASQVVTEIDLLSEKSILKILSPTCPEFDLALLTEETTDDKSRLKKDYFWCIDPLDGTLPFTESKAGYSVSIALVAKSGEPQLGVIYDPYYQNTYYAIKGLGAFKNNSEWKPNSSSDKDSSFSFVHNRSFLNHSHFEYICIELESFSNKILGKSLNIISYGGAAMNAIWALENSPACYFALPKPENGGGSSWDYAATTCIYNELGKPASDIYGSPLELNRRESTFMNHKGILYASNEEIAQYMILLLKNL